jgi:hypothetical protein
MFDNFLSSKDIRDQVVGLVILSTFCLFSFAIGFSGGKEAGRLEENPQALAAQAAREAAMNKHLDEVIADAIQKGDRSCAALASMLPK